MAEIFCHLLSPFCFKFSIFGCFFSLGVHSCKVSLLVILYPQCITKCYALLALWKVAIWGEHGWRSWLSTNFWCPLRSWFQCSEIESCIGLHDQCRINLGFTLPLFLPLSPAQLYAHSLCFSPLKYIKKLLYIWFFNFNISILIIGTWTVLSNV